MNNKINIRDNVTEDNNAIIAIVISVLDEFSISVSREEVEADLRLCEFGKMMDRSKCWVVTNGDKVIGCAMVHPLTESTCELKRMYILPEYRGKGHGKQLLERVLEFARNRKYKRIELDTHSRMKSVRKLYKRVGFQEFDYPARNRCCNQSMYLDIYK